MATQKTKNTWAYNGVTYTSLEALCQSTGASYDRVYYRVRHGWTLVDALTAPVYSREPVGLARKTVARLKDALKIRNPERAITAVEHIMDDFAMQTMAQDVEKESCEPRDPSLPLITPSEAAQFLREHKEREDKQMESARMSDSEVLSTLDQLLEGS